MRFIELPAPATHDEQRAWLGGVRGIAEKSGRAARRAAIGWSWGRLATFLCIPYGIYLWLGSGPWYGCALSLVGAGLFCLAVRRHEDARREVDAARQLAGVCDESTRRLDGAPEIVRSGVEPPNTAFWADSAARWLGNTPHQELSRQEIDDLDVFGERLSLFGLLNRTSTPVGAATLACMLTHPVTDGEMIRARQDATRALSTDGAVRVRLLAALAAMRGMDASCAKLREAFADASAPPHAGRLAVVRWWGLAGPAALVVSIGQSAGWWAASVGWMALVIILIVNAIILPSFMRGVRERLRPWLELEPMVARLGDLAEVASAHLAREGVLGDIRGRFAALRTRDALPMLHRRIPFVYLGLAGIVHTLIDVLCFWDLQVLCLLNRPLLTHKSTFLGAMAAMGELEGLCSLACHAAEQPGAMFPRVVEGGDVLRIVEGRHPLINHREAVPNSLELMGDRRTWVITGSNMSGKSTFLRMAGTNVLLAQMGGAVCAKEMTWRPMELITDLRIRDDLSRKESYFLAEVRQVRRMVEAARQGRSFLALIDEPFRGTNSAERVAAAGAVICALIGGGGLHLVATHDAALSALADRKGIPNYHFQEEMERDELVFDHWLRSGPARGRNALRVLEIEGYPADVVAEARRFVSELTDAGASTAPGGGAEPN